MNGGDADAWRKVLVGSARKGEVARVQQLFRFMTTEMSKEALLTHIDEAMAVATINGHLAVVKTCFEQKQAVTSLVGSPTASVNVMDLAAEYGQLPIVAWLHSVGMRCTLRAIDAAATNGHLAVVVFLCNHRSEGFTPAALFNAAKNGHLIVLMNLVAWWHNVGDSNALIEIMLKAWEVATANRHAQVAKWIYAMFFSLCEGDDNKDDNMNTVAKTYYNKDDNMNTVAKTYYFNICFNCNSLVRSNNLLIQ